MRAKERLDAVEVTVSDPKSFLAISSESSGVDVVRFVDDHEPNARPEEGVADELSELRVATFGGLAQLLGCRYYYLNISWYFPSRVVNMSLRRDQ